MDGLILLRDARRAGLRVKASGDRLVVEGPRRLEAMARTLLAEKPRVLRALAEEEHEVAWRAAVMAAQVPWAGAIPLLLARPGIRFPPGSCCSCGDPRPTDRYRCAPCAVATVHALAAVQAAGVSA